MRVPLGTVLSITQQVLEDAGQVVTRTGRIKGIDVLDRVVIDQLRQQITAYLRFGR